MHICHIKKIYSPITPYLNSQPFRTCYWLLSLVSLAQVRAAAAAAAATPLLHHTTCPLPSPSGISPVAGGSGDPSFLINFLVDLVLRVMVYACQVSWYWGFISFSSSSPAMARGQGEIIFSALLKMRAAIAASATSSARQHGDLSFETATSRWR